MDLRRRRNRRRFRRRRHPRRPLTPPTRQQKEATSAPGRRQPDRDVPVLAGRRHRRHHRHRVHLARLSQSDPGRHLGLAPPGPGRRTHPARWVRRRWRHQRHCRRHRPTGNQTTTGRIGTDHSLRDHGRRARLGPWQPRRRNHLVADPHRRRRRECRPHLRAHRRAGRSSHRSQHRHRPNPEKRTEHRRPHPNRRHRRHHHRPPIRSGHHRHRRRENHRRRVRQPSPATIPHHPEAPDGDEPHDTL